MNNNMNITIIHRLGKNRMAYEYALVSLDNESCAKTIAELINTSPGKEEATYSLNDIRYHPLTDILRFERWIEKYLN